MYFISGDIVGLYDETTSESITGVILSISNKTAILSLDDSADNLDHDGTYFMAKLANDVTFKRLKR